MITTADLNKIKETFINAMKKNFKNDGKIYSVAIVISKDGELTFIGTTFSNNEEKAQMMSEVKKIIQKVDAIAVMIINEAWASEIKKEDYQKVMGEMRKNGTGVKDLTDKKEVAVMVFETKLTTETIVFDLDKQNKELTNRTSGRTEGGNFQNILCPTIQKN